MENRCDKPFIQAENQKFWLKVFDFAFERMVRKGFYSLRIKNAENFNLRDPDKGNIIYGIHSCWWDGIIAYLLCRQVFKTQINLMIEELYRFPLLSKIGAFSVEKKSPQSAIKALNYSIDIIKNPEKSLWIYPQGIVMPPDSRPLKFASGISYLCKKSGGVNLIPVANRYTFLREDRPEILVEVGKPIIINNNNLDKKEFTHYLENEFTEFLDKQREEISQGKLGDYELVFKSRLCVAKLIEKHFTNFVRTFNT